MNNPDIQALELAALTSEHPDEAAMGALIARVRMHIARSIASVPTDAEESELRALCARLVALGAGEAHAHSVGGYAARYMRAVELLTALEELLTAYLNRKVAASDFEAELYKLGPELMRLYSFIDPTAFMNGAHPAALPSPPATLFSFANGISQPIAANATAPTNGAQAPTSPATSIQPAPATSGPPASTNDTSLNVPTVHH